MNPDSTAALFSGTNGMGQLSGADAGAFALAAPALGPVLLKLALGLGAVIVLILVLQRFARRFGGGLPRRGDPIQLLAQRPLGPRLSLAVVEVMDRTFLVGVSPHGIAKVADLTSARTRQAKRAWSAQADERSAGHAAQTAAFGPASADRFAGTGWKGRLVRSFARVLSGGNLPASGAFTGTTSTPEYADAVGPTPAHPASLQAASPLSWTTDRPQDPMQDTRTRDAAMQDAMLQDATTQYAAIQDAMPQEPSTSAEAAFEIEFRRRLEEIQSRYPQVSELDAQARREA